MTNLLWAFAQLQQLGVAPARGVLNEPELGLAFGAPNCGFSAESSLGSKVKRVILMKNTLAQTDATHSGVLMVPIP